MGFGFQKLTIMPPSRLNASWWMDTKTLGTPFPSPKHTPLASTRKENSTLTGLGHEGYSLSPLRTESSMDSEFTSHLQVRMHLGHI